MHKKPLKKTGRKRTQNSLPLVLAGMGLIIFGVAAAIIVFEETNRNQAQAQAGEVLPQIVNYPAPELQLVDVNGQTVDLKAYTGQVVLLNNWATWCPPCRAEMPALQVYHTAHQEQGFTVVAVEAGDPIEQVRQFVDEYGLTFPVWVDTRQQALAAFRNMALPNSYVMDRAGQVRLAWNGAISLETLDKYVTPLLEE
ncbi:MAG TPA: TlpA disulfide reductase family protein [Anaerolineales bacterium]|nr:TlpA disulfide reductase family protein [Anaerolineales bacterium]